MVKSVYFCDICGQNFNPNGEANPPNGRMPSYRVCIDGINICDDTNYILGDARDINKENLRCVCYVCREAIGKYIRERRKRYNTVKEQKEREFNSTYLWE